MSNIENTTKCPHCMTEIDVNATTCAHCGKDVAIQMMFVKNPKAGGYGILFAIISVILSYFIHNEYISTSFALFWHENQIARQALGAFPFI